MGKITCLRKSPELISGLHTVWREPAPEICPLTFTCAPALTQQQHTAHIHVYPVINNIKIK